MRNLRSVLAGSNWRVLCTALSMRVSASRSVAYSWSATNVGWMPSRVRLNRASSNSSRRRARP
ncbi:hypothetical protein D3C72_2447850 [compost metagenome]